MGQVIELGASFLLSNYPSVFSPLFRFNAASFTLSGKRLLKIHITVARQVTVLVMPAIRWILPVTKSPTSLKFSPSTTAITS